MKTAEFLFPRDLEVTPSNLNRVLLIGSCLSEYYKQYWNQINPNLALEHILFNNASELPSKSNSELAAYDFAYIQIPIRMVLTDAVIRFADLESVEYIQGIVENAKRNIDAMLGAALAYNRQMKLLTIVANFVEPQVPVAPSITDHGGPRDLTDIVRGLNAYLRDWINGESNVFLADVNAVASSLGKRFVIDDFIGFYTHGSVFFDDWAEMEWGRIEPIPALTSLYENRTMEFFEATLRQAEAIYRTVNQIDMVKLVIFDLDNTLWRGQIAEAYQNGMEWPHHHGWPLGVWETVHQLRARGILTAICSKNDEEVVRRLWNNAMGLEWVKLDDFVCAKISWRPKAESVGEILRTLALTAKSVVFVDDNPVEREAVKAAFPGIRVIGSNPFLTRRVLLWSPESNMKAMTSESANRENMIRRQIVRETERAVLSREDFLRQLEAEVSLRRIESASDPAYSRALELVNKTNQFNTTGRRWTNVELVTFLVEGGDLYTFEVKDKYAAYGLVGVVLVKEARFEQFVMSCRVIGMEVETSAVAEIIRDQRIRKSAQGFTAPVYETESNSVCRDVYLRCGFMDFSPSDVSSGSNEYLFNLGAEPVVFSHVKIDTLMS